MDRKKTIYSIRTRGYCAGVKRALEIVEKCLKKYGKPLFVNHEIIHNNYVIEKLEKKGVNFRTKISNIPEGSNLIISAHGCGPQIFEQAEKKNINIIDATCPLVRNIHKEAILYGQKGYKIYLIGKKNHEEVIGISEEAPLTIVSSLDDVKHIKNAQNTNILKQKSICLVQTTFEINKANLLINKLREAIPDMENSNVTCFATQKRQNIIKEQHNKFELLLVVGSKLSNNSNTLVKTAKKLGIESILIENEKDLRKNKLEKFNSIAITAGASTPEELSTKVIQAVKIFFPNNSYKEIGNKPESINFPLPKELQ